MNYKRQIKKMLPVISNEIKRIGGGIPESFQCIDKLKYEFTIPVVDSSENFDGRMETYYVMYVNLVNVNGFLYPTEMFDYIKIRKDPIDNKKTYNIYLKKKYSGYSNLLDNSIELKDVPDNIKNELRLHYDISEIGLRKKIVVSLPSKLVMIDGLKEPFVITR